MTDQWHYGKHDSHYLTRDGVTVAVVFERSNGWHWCDFKNTAIYGPHKSLYAAMRTAAKEAGKGA